MTGKTLLDKLWDPHIIYQESGQPALIYIDRHYLHEVTSPQAFDGLRSAKRKVRRPELTFATIDHNIPTTSRSLPIIDQVSARQIATLQKNCSEFGIKIFSLNSPYNGIVHVIGPELGLTLPGLTIVCGDSHTSTHGAFGSIAFGIGTSEVEHVLATQSILMEKPKSFRITIDGSLQNNVTSKDVILSLIGKIGISGGTGYIIEYCGETIEQFSMDDRMTICNMTIESGARSGIIAPDKKTFDYLKNRIFAPKKDIFNDAIDVWKDLKTDPSSKFDKEYTLDVSNLAPQVTWGTTPGMVSDVTHVIPSSNDFSDHNEQESVMNALQYMGLKSGTPIVEINIGKVFIGSCTNSRITDLKSAAKIVKGRKVLSTVKAIVVPGSQMIKQDAEAQGIAKIFKDAGFEWRESGCSMCLGMNPDILLPGERCASTSNRNFEGRQGRGGRTHLVSPEMAAAAAIAGHFVDIREWDLQK